MIKAGLLGGSDPLTGQLLPLLLHHPDVDLRWVLSSGLSGRPLCDVHPRLIGETDLLFIDRAGWQETDVVFCCDDTALPVDLPEHVRMIDLTARHRADDSEQSGYTYGMPEFNRRVMVHDCRRVVCPGALPMALLLALTPLARNLMLNSELHVMVVMPADGRPTGSRAEFVPIPDADTDEVRHRLAGLQTSFASGLHMTAARSAHARGMLVSVYFKCAIEVGMVRQLFEQYYADHNFTFVSDRSPRLGDVVGTNKCLLHIEHQGEYLRITSAIDNRMKGGAGNAVHVMNLLFGLHERTGLNL